MAIRSVRDVVLAHEEGRVRNYAWNKTNAAMSGASNIWADISGASGNPRGKQWFDASPLVAQQVRQSTDGGFYHGPDVAPSVKYAREFRMHITSAVVPCAGYICDYLLYYPTIEDATTDPQLMDNSNTLPRYTDGNGVQMMAVSISARTGGQTFSVQYTNSDGVAGRITPAVTQNSGTIPGIIVNTTNVATNFSVGPFMPLQDGDSGVRSIESVTMNGLDTGFFAIVLVKPLFSITAQNVIVPYEKDLLLMQSEMPIIEDDAYLSAVMIFGAAVTTFSPRGSLKVIWG